MEHFDAIIIGGGPGGLQCAKALAKAGKSVLLLEKNKQMGPKVCAGGITNKDLAFVPEELHERTFDNVAVHTPRQSVRLGQGKPYVITIDRGRFGQWQAKMAREAGAEIRKAAHALAINGEDTGKALAMGGEAGAKAPAMGMEPGMGALAARGKSGGRISIEASISGKERNFSCDRLVGADGSNSLVRRHLGLPTKIAIAFHYAVPGDFENMELFFDVKRFGPWYAWIFPHKGWASIGAGADPRILPIATLRKNFEQWVDEKGLFEREKAKFEAAPISYHYAGHQFGNKFLVGDAAGLASGLSGEGMYFAMVSGDEAARKILDKNYACPRIGELLGTKRSHERLLRLIKLSDFTAKLGYECLLLALRSRWFAEKVIALCA